MTLFEFNEWQAFTANATTRTYNSFPRYPQIHCPIKDRFIPIQSVASIFYLRHVQTTTVTNSGGAPQWFYSDYSSHGFMLEVSIICIYCIPIDSEKGIEYFLDGWHLVLSSPLLCVVKEEDRSRMSRMPTFFYFASIVKSD
jgi:hypothetical protein